LGNLVDRAIDGALTETPANHATEALSRHGQSSPADIAAARATFEGLAVEHLAQVRGLMVETRAGEPSSSWIAPALSELKTLGKMAQALDLRDLCSALDGLAAVLDEAKSSGGAVIEGAMRKKVIEHYRPLTRALPGAFDENEGDRREAIIVQELLRQAPEIEELARQRLYAAGLNRLQACLRARADEVAATTGLSIHIAARAVEVFQAYRDENPSVLAAVDRADESRRLAVLIAELEKVHDAFERAAAGWSREDRLAKRRLRREREAAFGRTRLALARLGDLNLLARLEKQAFQKRIELLHTYVADLKNMSVRRGSEPRETRPPVHEENLSPTQA
jgi:hypothetical protein